MTSYKERLLVELYQVFRDYSGLEIDYNAFCKAIDKLTIELGESKCTHQKTLQKTLNHALPDGN